MKMTAKEYPLPDRLDRTRATQSQVAGALEASCSGIVTLIRRSLEAGGHVKGFRPDVVALVCSSITHEAHHRGQVTHWLRELNSPIDPENQLRLWEWDKVWKDLVQ